MKITRGLITKIVAAASISVLALIVFSYWNGVRNTGIRLERQLTSQYLDNQNYLSAFISGFYEQVSVAQTQSDRLNTVLNEAVKGRYEGEGGFSVDSAFFAAVVEAYPEASLEQLLENWGKIQDYIASQREGYRNVQSKLLDQLRTYDTWRETGLFKHLFVGWIGFPSGSLEARIGRSKTTGDEAREQMYAIVLTEAAKEAYEEGEMAPLEVPGPTGATP